MCGKRTFARGVGLLTVALLLSGCGGSSSSTSGGVAGGPAGGASGSSLPVIGGRGSASATSSPTVPNQAAFNAFQAACLQKTSTFLNGRVVWPTTANMTVGTDSTVSVVVTLNPSAAPSALLSGANAGVAAVQATCGVQASVVFDPAEFSILDSAPQYRSLLPDGEARWDWVVTPQLSGQRDLVFQLQPIVLIGPEGQPVNSAAAAGTKTFPCTVTVAPAKGVTATVTRATSFLTSVKGLIAAITGIVAALAALWAALRHFRSQKRRARKKPAKASEAPAARKT